MGKRSDLQQELKRLFRRPNEPHVYYQPPESLKLVYPCVVFRLTGFPDGYADNLPYFSHREYQLTVIDPDPESDLRERVAKLKWCRFVRSYVSDDLHHFVFELNY